MRYGTYKSKKMTLFFKRLFTVRVVYANSHQITVSSYGMLLSVITMKGCSIQLFYVGVVN